MSQAPESSRSANIFINYRREDTSGHAGRLFDRLSNRFPGRVFMDIDTLAPGVDFVDAIEQAVGSCEVLIVMIGREWLTLTDADGHRRLDNPTDFVRLEVASALQRDIRVIPVLVQDAPMPRPAELPPDLAKLARRNAIELSDARWLYDVDRLIGTIEEVLRERQPIAPAIAAPAAAAGSAKPKRWLIPIGAVALAIAVWIGWTMYQSREASVGPEAAENVADPAPTAPSESGDHPANADAGKPDVADMEPAGPPPPPPPDELPKNCLAYDPKTLQIEGDGAKWLLSSGDEPLLYVASEPEAEKALALSRNHTALCAISVGSAIAEPPVDDILWYWMGDSGQASSVPQEDCVTYEPSRLEIQQDGEDRWLITDGSSSLLRSDSQTDAEKTVDLANLYTKLCFFDRGQGRDLMVRYLR